MVAGRTTEVWRSEAIVAVYLSDFVTGYIQITLKDMRSQYAHITNITTWSNWIGNLNAVRAMGPNGLGNGDYIALFELSCPRHEWKAFIKANKMSIASV